MPWFYPTTPSHRSSVTYNNDNNDNKDHQWPPKGVNEEGNDDAASEATATRSWYSRSAIVLLFLPLPQPLPLPPNPNLNPMSLKHPSHNPPLNPSILCQAEHPPREGQANQGDAAVCR